MKNEDSVVAEEEARQQALAQAMDKLKKCMKRHIARSELLRNWYVAVKRAKVECYPLVKTEDPNQTKMVEFASPRIKPTERRGKNE